MGLSTSSGAWMGRHQAQWCAAVEGAPLNGLVGAPTADFGAPARAVGLEFGASTSRRFVDGAAIPLYAPRFSLGPPAQRQRTTPRAPDARLVPHGRALEPRERAARGAVAQQRGGGLAHGARVGRVRAVASATRSVGDAKR